MFFLILLFVIRVKFVVFVYEVFFKIYVVFFIDNWEYNNLNFLYYWIFIKGLFIIVWVNIIFLFLFIKVLGLFIIFGLFK